MLLLFDFFVSFLNHHNNYITLAKYEKIIRNHADLSTSPPPSNSNQLLLAKDPPSQDPPPQDSPPPQAPEPQDAPPPPAPSLQHRASPQQQDHPLTQQESQSQVISQEYFYHNNACSCNPNSLSFILNFSGGLDSSILNLAPYCILRFFIEQKWKEQSDYLITHGVNDTNSWAYCGKDVINQVCTNRDRYGVLPSDLKLVCLFEDNDTIQNY